MTQDTLFQNLYIVYFKQRSRIVKYNTHFKDETVCFMVKHHAHSIRLSKSTAPAGSVPDQDPLCVVTALACFTMWNWSGGVYVSFLCTRAGFAPQPVTLASGLFLKIQK